MTKTKKVKEEVVEEEVVQSPTIIPLGGISGNEDLNKLVDKVNEIILHLNSVL